MAQVFTKCLDNAIRYTPTGGRGTITGRLVKNLPRPKPRRAGGGRADGSTSRSERGDFVEISIADTGPGIPPESVPRVFDRFYRVDKARSRRLGGAGLGLSLVKDVVEAYGGHVEVQSEVGQGSRFTLRLPVRS